MVVVADVESGGDAAEAGDEASVCGAGNKGAAAPGRGHSSG